MAPWKNYLVNYYHFHFRHDSRKSRIPTPVHFNSGRKSATGVLYHDSTASKSAIRSNVEGVSSVEMDTMNRKSVHSTNKSTTSNMGKHTQYQTSKKRIDPRDGYVFLFHFYYREPSRYAGIVICHNIP